MFGGLIPTFGEVTPSWITLSALFQNEMSSEQFLVNLKTTHFDKLPVVLH